MRPYTSPTAAAATRGNANIRGSPPLIRSKNSSLVRTIAIDTHAAPHPPSRRAAAPTSIANSSRNGYGSTLLNHRGSIALLARIMPHS
ncbi:MAG TPA: hypothetical protein VGR35_12340 [Tepidisphaeraceae bacterium]|nr:hypothetical protein [Tepidisphaeraceae bacterium]